MDLRDPGPKAEILTSEASTTPKAFSCRSTVSALWHDVYRDVLSRLSCRDEVLSKNSEQSQKELLQHDRCTSLKWGATIKIISETPYPTFLLLFFFNRNFGVNEGGGAKVDHTMSL